MGVAALLSGQNLLVGGNMEDEDAWTVHYPGSEEFADYEFNFTDDTASIRRLNRERKKYVRSI